MRFAIHHRQLCCAHKTGFWICFLADGATHREQELRRAARASLTTWGRRGHIALCVRLCDGFYWPLSHSTTRARFSKDAKQCEASCPGRSQLFVQRSGSEDAEGIVDLKGAPYTQLKNALRYRTEYVQDCTCRGNPWDPEAIARHRGYAEAAKSAQETSGQHKTQATTAKSTSQSDRWARAEARD